MGSYIVTIRVRREVAELVEEMIRLGIAENRNQAYNMLIEAGLSKIREIINHKRKARRLVEEFLEKGLPYKELPTIDDVYEGRSR